LAVSIVTLYSILRHIGDDSASEEGSTCNGDFMMSQKRYVATACTFATGQVIPLAKITRDRFVASLHQMDGAPHGLKALSGTTESYITALFFFVVSIGFCVHSIADLAAGTDETISLITSFFFLICSASWVCKTTRDRSDVTNGLWEETDRRDRMTPVILRLARGTGTNVLLCIVAFAGSVILTLICIWKSSNEGFDSTLKLLLTMGEFFQVVAAFWMAKTVRDAAIEGQVTMSTWFLAAAGLVAALAFTYVGLFVNWDSIGASLGITLWTALSFSLFSTFFLSKLVRDHKELENKGWEASLMGTLCAGGTMTHLGHP